jgi:hypothetical protein
MLGASAYRKVCGFVAEVEEEESAEPREGKCEGFGRANVPHGGVAGEAA